MNIHRSWSSRFPVLAISVLLASCGGTAAPSSPTSGVATSAPSLGSVPPSAPGSVSGTSGAIDVCQVVTQADVAPFFTAPITAEEDTSQTGEFSGCFYQVSPHDGLAPMEIYVVSGDQAAGTYGSRLGGNEGRVPLTGIGDRAVRSPGSASFTAIKGSTFCEVDLGGGNSSHYAALPSPDANGMLPDAAAEAYALRLGALCAKIWAASGS